MTCEESEEVRHAKLLEVQAVKVAESGNLGDALELLTKTISEVPNYASVYNNRAQVRCVCLCRSFMFIQV